MACTWPGWRRPRSASCWWAAVLSQPGHRPQPRERRRVPWPAAGGRADRDGDAQSVTAVASTATAFTSATRSRFAARSPSTRASRSQPSSARSSICGRILSLRARARMLREALRLGATAAPRMQSAIRAHRGRRGVASLRVEVEKLAGLRLERCRSDAEAWAVALIADTGLESARSQRERRRRRGRPELAGGAAHHRARRPQLPRPPRHRHPQDEGLASGRLRRPATAHARRLRRARAPPGDRCRGRTSVLPPHDGGRPTFGAPGAYGTSACAASRIRSRPS